MSDDTVLSRGPVGRATPWPDERPAPMLLSALAAVLLTVGAFVASTAWFPRSAPHVPPLASLRVVLASLPAPAAKPFAPPLPTQPVPVAAAPDRLPMPASPVVVPPARNASLPVPAVTRRMRSPAPVSRSPRRPARPHPRPPAPPRPREAAARAATLPVPVAPPVAPDTAAPPTRAAAAAAVPAGAADTLQGRIRAAVQAALRYPDSARMMGEQGRVLVGFDYRDAAASAIRLLRPSGDARLDAAALATVRNAAYPAPPRVLAGHTLVLAVWVRFRIDGDDD